MQIVKTDSEILNVTQLAEFLGVSVDAVYSWTFKRAIPHFKLGKMLRFNKSEIIHWLEAKRVEPFHESRGNYDTK